MIYVLLNISKIILEFSVHIFLFTRKSNFLVFNLLLMLSFFKATVAASPIISLAALNGILGLTICWSLFISRYRCRQYMGKNRPKEISNSIDPRICSSEEESFILKSVR